MSVEYQSYAYFTVVSSQPLSAIEDRIGIAGDGKCWSIGDLRPSQKGTYDFSRWSMNSGVGRGRPIDEHLESLWRRLSPYRDQIVGLPPEMYRAVPCVAWFASAKDTFQISSGHFVTVAEFGARFDFDFYFDD